MKKIFAITLAALSLTLTAQAQRAVGDVVTNTDGVSYKITSLNPALAEVTESPFAEGQIEILAEFVDYDITYKVTKIAPKAFLNMSGENQAITGTLIIPEGIEEIGWQAFLGCNRIDSISFPSTLTKIGNSAFYCYNDKPSTLKGLSIAALVPPTCGDMVFGSRFNAKEGVSRDIILWVPKGKVFTYRAETQWDYFNYITDGEEISWVDEQHYNPDPDAQGIEDIESDNSPRKVVVDGQVLIELNGERYSVHGQKLQ